MKKITTIALVGMTLASLCSTAHSALVSRLGGAAVYDTDLNITWLSNANLAATNTFGVTGINAAGYMDWNKANQWINAMNSDGGTGYLGVNNWRLTTVPVFDGDCSINPAGAGFNCRGSEFGHLFYDEFNATAGSSYTTGNPAQTGLFSNIQTTANYWTGSTYSGTTFARVFNMSNGQQAGQLIDVASPGFAWAMTNGDVSPVPVPAAVWLLGSGLLGFAGIKRFRRDAE